MKINITEAFRAMAGSEEFHNEEGILQEAVENIIPPAFNRLADFAKLGEMPIGESGLGIERFHDRPSGEAYQAAMKKYVEENAMPSKAAQDVFAQYIVRYHGRSYEYRGQQMDHAFNPMSINRMFLNVTNRFRGNPHYLAWYDNTSMEGSSFGHIDDDTKDFSDALASRRRRGPRITQEQAEEWYALKEKIDAFFASFERGSDTSRQWVDKGRAMAARGASAKELLVYMGRQYKSYVKSIKKFYKKHPKIASVEAEHMELVRRAWNYKQDQLISHSMGNLAKIGKFLREEKYVGELAALLKKHPDRNEVDDDNFNVIHRDSLYHANEFIDSEMLKGQLDACEEGWASAQMGNDETSEDAPCVLHEYDDGFFWWNRKASSCDIAGEDMANCGSSNYEDSTLIILKERVNNDSAEVMDKLKGRVMVEYNSGTGEMVQILGFGNSFPDAKYWDKIKDLHDNLGVQEISKWAFQHLRERGRTTQETIDAFLDFIAGGSRMKPPEDFFFNDAGNSFMDRIRAREYDLEAEADFGGRSTLSFDAYHNSTNKRYAPIGVSIYLRPLYYPALPETLSDDRHPSLDPKVSKSLVEEGESFKNIKKNFVDLLRYSMSSALTGITVAAGSNSDAARRMADSFEFVRFRVQPRGGTYHKGARIQIRATFDIPPEVFTYEEISRPDDPQADLAWGAIKKIREKLGGDKLLTMLNTAVSVENARVNPQEFTEFIPGVDDQPVGQHVLNLAELTQEMEAIRIQYGRTNLWADLQDRMEVIYRSLVSPRDDGSGYLNIDAIPRDIASRWEYWLEEQDNIDANRWLEEWTRIYGDSRRRIQAMQQGEENFADQEPEYYGLENEDLVARWLPPNYGGRNNPIGRGTAGRFISRVMHQFRNRGGFEGLEDIERAQVNAIAYHYDIDAIGLGDEDLESYRDFVRAQREVNVAGDSQLAFGDDGEDFDDITDDEAEAAMADTGIDWYDQLDQFDAEEYEARRNYAQRDLERQAAMNNPEPIDDVDRLLTRGNMLLRFFGHRERAQFNQAERGNLERFKQNMQDHGIWDQWWSRVADDHPLKNVDWLQQEQIVVESAHMNEDSTKRKGGVLPFKKDAGEFYFLLGQAPQGWWSDFRGGEEASDDGNLMVTAAREFTEESSFELPVTLDDAFRIEDKNVAVYLADLAELNPEDFDVNKVMKIDRGHYAGVPEIVAVQWFHINELPQIPKSRMPIIQKALQMLTAPEPIGSGMETSGGDAYTPFLNESEGLKTLHVFDFDDTIAFTKTYTYVTTPTGRRFKVDQEGLDDILQKYGGEERLRELGFDLDFSGFKTVDPSSRLNGEIAQRIATCCQAGGEDPSGDFYVVTARSRAAEDSIHQYLTDNGIVIPRKKVIGVEGKSKGDKIKSLILGTDIENVTFYDDSENNIQDVAKLREDPDLQGVSFELYHIKDGGIPKNPMQETIYERKAFKITVGAR